MPLAGAESKQTRDLNRVYFKVIASHRSSNIKRLSMALRRSFLRSLQAPQVDKAISQSVKRRNLSDAALSAGTEITSKPSVCWLDLRGTGLSILERLVLEEYLWKHDSQNWVICGSHSPQPHRFLRVVTPTAPRMTAPVATESLEAAWNVDESQPNDAVAIVLGIGGKPDLLLHVDAVRADRVATARRFSGGGTVVLDPDSLWTTIIGRRNPGNELVSEIGPRTILQYTADTLYAPMFEKLVAMQKSQRSNAVPSNPTMVLDAKSCGLENSGRVVMTSQTVSPSAPDVLNASFALLENDFVWGQHKIGGNAQSIGQSGWLQHTSFVWDYQPDSMAYLTLPSKRPDYRGNRTHADFLLKLQTIFPSLTRADIVAALQATCRDCFAVQDVRLPHVMSLAQESHGGMQAWFDTKSRTKIITHLV